MAKSGADDGGTRRSAKKSRAGGKPRGAKRVARKPAERTRPADERARRSSEASGRDALRLTPSGLTGALRRDDASSPIRGATWYVASAEGDGLTCTFAPGTLAGMNFLTADFLLDGQRLGVFDLTLREGERGPRFGLTFALLPHCSARMRVRLEAVDQNRWRFEREGAWLKPLCHGDRVDLARVDRMAIACGRKGDEPVRWCMTDPAATRDEPPLMDELVLPKGKLLDEMGQCATRVWPGRSRSTLEVTARLESQLAQAELQRWPEGWSRWGGSAAKRFDATGFFRTHHDGTRWWLVDPDGCAFWSAGADCVCVDTDVAYAGLEEALAWLPDAEAGYEAAYGARRGTGPGRTVNYLAANFVRAFGPDEWYRAWSAIVLSQLKRFGFNTVANWSDWRIAREAQFPYVRPLDAEALAGSPARKLPMVFRDFPDVFDPVFDGACAAYAQQLVETADDPALVGYFLMNEPTWGFAKETPAAGMLFATPACASRTELARFLRQKYGTDDALGAAWGMETSFDETAAGSWTKPLTDGARADLAAFSELMCAKLFATLSDACRAVDPNHLNLGARYHTVPPAWAAKGMSRFDVFSMNCYRERVPAEELARIAKMLSRPILVGEWHFGAHDVGLPASGIGRVKDQAARGAAFRLYTEDAAAKPECIGVHYFTLYDQSALGRFDGECYNIGFLDVCNNPYEDLATMARLAHERLYGIAAGEVPPTDEVPEYLPKLFL